MHAVLINLATIMRIVRKTKKVVTHNPEYKLHLINP